MSTIVFGIRSYAKLASEIARINGWTPGEIDVRDFPDGERYQRIVTDISGENVVLVGGTPGDSETLELYDLACALAKYGAERLDLVVPYFGYSTMERAVKPGEVVTAKTRARLLSVIPRAARGNRVFFLDLHAEGIPHYLEGDVTAFHIYAKSLVIDIARRIAGDDFVLASTDAGRAKWVQSLANDMNVQASFVFKKRIDGERTAVTAVSAHVENRHVIIYDDMIRTGGSLLNAARAYLDAGAKTISVITTHGIFPGEALKKLRASGILATIHTTDSHPRAKTLEDDFLTVHPIARILAGALKPDSLDISH
jgi:ribose-phosphate pyrophosphokinase